MGVRTAPLSDVFAPTRKNFCPTCHSRAIFPTLVGLCFWLLTFWSKGRSCKVWRLMPKVCDNYEYLLTPFWAFFNASAFESTGSWQAAFNLSRVFGDLLITSIITFLLVLFVRGFGLLIFQNCVGFWIILNYFKFLPCDFLLKSIAIQGLFLSLESSFGMPQFLRFYGHFFFSILSRCNFVVMCYLLSFFFTALKVDHLRLELWLSDHSLLTPPNWKLRMQFLQYVLQFYLPINFGFLLIALKRCL